MGVKGVMGVKDVCFDYEKWVEATIVFNSLDSFNSFNSLL